MAIRNVLLDLDDTILDFHKGEYIAMCRTLEEFGIVPTDEVIGKYREINRSCWQALERGEMKRDDVLTTRFALLFSALGVTASPEDVQSFYEKRLSEGAYFMVGAEELLKSLFGKYKLYIASNGTAFVQDRRIAASGIAKYFDGIFISERMGAHKPSAEFFDACFERMGGAKREETVIVGDSLTSDILGGINAGIHTLYLSDKKAEGGIAPEYCCESLSEVEKIIESIK